MVMTNTKKILTIFLTCHKRIEKNEERSQQVVQGKRKYSHLFRDRKVKGRQRLSSSSGYR